MPSNLPSAFTTAPIPNTESKEGVLVLAFEGSKKSRKFVIRLVQENYGKPNF